VKAATECVNAVLKVLLEKTPGAVGQKSGPPMSFGRSLQKALNDCCVLPINDRTEFRAENECACTGLIELTRRNVFRKNRSSAAGG
jgi:hypothetical protein